MEENKQQIPAAYKPIGAWGYFGWQLLFALPIAGWILLIIFACGVSENKNLTAFARSYFCWFLILLIIVGILAVLGISGFAFISNVDNILKLM